MLISRALLDELIAHAHDEAPNECCGFVIVEPGPPAQAVGVRRVLNLAVSELRFEVDPETLLKINNEAEEAGQALAIYHSHTRSAPYPSQTDINFAVNWPGVEWLIVGLAGDEPQVRSYLIESGKVREVALGEEHADMSEAAER